MVRHCQGLCEHPHLDGRWEHGALEARVIVRDQTQGQTKPNPAWCTKGKTVLYSITALGVSVSVRAGCWGWISRHGSAQPWALSACSILQQLQRDQALAAAPDKSRFRSLSDAVQRLLSYHACQGSVPTEEDLRRGEPWVIPRRAPSRLLLFIADLPSSQVTWLSSPCWDLWLIFLSILWRGAQMSGHFLGKFEGSECRTLSGLRLQVGPPRARFSARWFRRSPCI